MIRQEIDIDGWWWVTVFYQPSPDDLTEVTRAYEEVECPWRELWYTQWLIRTGQMNKGYSYSNERQRRSVVFIGRADSWEQFQDTVAHEVRHVVDDIVWFYRVENKGEPPAYTQGELARQMAPAIRKIACPCCGMIY